MVERDFQRSKVYKAEDKVDHGRVFTSVKEMQDYCDRLAKSKWWQDRFQHITKIVVGDGRRRSRANGYRSGNTIRINMPRHSRKELIVLHEVVHGLKPIGVPWHGKEYCGDYIRVVRHFMGAKVGKELQDSFDSHGVLYTE